MVPELFKWLDFQEQLALKMLFIWDFQEQLSDDLKGWLFFSRCRLLQVSCVLQAWKNVSQRVAQVQHHRGSASSLIWTAMPLRAASSVFFDVPAISGPSVDMKSWKFCFLRGFVKKTKLIKNYCKLNVVLVQTNSPTKFIHHGQMAKALFGSILIIINS